MWGMLKVKMEVLGYTMAIDDLDKRKAALWSLPAI